MNPIIDWGTHDVYEFLEDAKCKMNPLYAEGQCRVGCVGCPMAGDRRIDEFRRWPSYKRLYMQAFDKMLLERKRNGLKTFQWFSAEDVYNWWMEYDILPGQMEMEDFLGEDADE